MSMMQIGQESIKGLIRLVQTDEQNCVIEGTIDGLPPGHHALCVHECGDVSEGCERLVLCFNSSTEYSKHWLIGTMLITELLNKAGFYEFQFSFF